MSSSLSLYDIEDALFELMNMREDTVAKLAEIDLGTSEAEELTEELKQIDLALAQYLTAEVHKVDSIHGWIKRSEIRRDEARQMAREAAERAKRLDAGVTRLKQICLDVLQRLGKKRIDGTAGRYITRQANGGATPIIVDHWDKEQHRFVVGDSVLALDRSLIDATITVPLDVLDRLFQASEELRQGNYSGEFCPNLARIKAELDEDCQACGGKGQVSPEASRPCEACAGTGRRTIAGARYGDRGEHVRIR